MEDSINMPASEVSKVLKQCLLDLLEGLSLLLHCIQIEGLHCLCLRVIGVLLENLLGILK